MTVSIRFATIDDYDSILNLIKQLYVIRKTSNFSTITKEEFLCLIENDSNYISIACYGDSIVGFLHAIYRKTTGQGKVIRIDENVVDRAFHGRGVGRKLIDNLIQNVQKKNISLIEVSVSLANNAAMEFYKKLKFEEFQKTFVLNLSDN